MFLLVTATRLTRMLCAWARPHEPQIAHDSTKAHHTPVYRTTGELAWAQRPPPPTRSPRGGHRQRAPQVLQAESNKEEQQNHQSMPARSEATPSQH